MKIAILSIAACLVSVGASAEVAPVEVRAPENGAWVGQRVPVFIDLRTKGSFGGATDFSTPRIPGGLWMKVGNATVSSRQIEGETYFVQSHEFAFYSQREGAVEIPSFEVRFGTRDGFTGPVTERREPVPATTVKIRRPPGTDAGTFLVTTVSYELSEQWDPAPGPATQGSVFKRTIIQRAGNIPGMALPPAPRTEPDGIKVYPPEVGTADKINRGDLTGERRETITYLMREPGTLFLPSITYQWWNPESEKLETRSLPAATFEIAPARPGSIPDAPGTTRRREAAWVFLSLFVACVALSQHRRLIAATGRAARRLCPPDRVAARRLLRACRRGDARGALAAWTSWKASAPDGSRAISGELHLAVVALQRHLFGPLPPSSWRPESLAEAFRSHLNRSRPSFRSRQNDLPPLNPDDPVERHVRLIRPVLEPWHRSSV